MPRPSQYLVRKAEALEAALEFFHRSSMSDESGLTSLDERYAIFLAQIDFWDWEVENLIYSFENFRARRAAWLDSDATIEMLTEHGFPLKPKVRERLEKVRKVRERRKPQALHEVQAPLEKLNAVIGAWNRLVTDAANIVMREENAERYGIKRVAPEQYRKKMLD